MVGLFVRIFLLSATLIKFSSCSYIYWKNITASYRDRTILSIGQGNMTSGRLLGVIGPSGCGKTTFLNSISGRIIDHSSFCLTADVKYNDINDKILLRHEIAYVDQLDSHFALLSVRETLALAASLKDIDDDPIQRKNLVESSLFTFNLHHVANTRVGDEDVRGMSGGEKKRLSIACELMGNKKVLIADEPTSGLDFFQAHQVISTFKKIAVEKRLIIVCTVHQPGSSIFSMLDDVLLLTFHGKVAYFGPRINILPYFDSIGYPCPALTNPAEFLIEIVSRNSTNKRSIEESLMRADALAEAFSSSSLYHSLHSTANIAEEDRAGNKNRHDIGSFSNISIAEQASKHGVVRLLFRPFRAIRTSFRRFSLVLGRALKQNLRDVFGSFALLSVSAILGFAISSVFKPSAGESLSLSDAVTAIANLAVNVAMLSTIKTLQTFKRERVVVQRERVQHSYNALEYLLAKLSLIHI